LTFLNAIVKYENVTKITQATDKVRTLKDRLKSTGRS